MRCLLSPLVILAMSSSAHALDWPQWLGPQRDGVWREERILQKFPPGGPVVKWRADLGGGFSGPAVVGDRVYVMDRVGDKLAKGREAPGKEGLRGKERVLCLDAKSGKELWQHAYDCVYTIPYTNGPRCTPTVHQGKVYALGAMGDLHCLDAASGKVFWFVSLRNAYRIKPPFWGWAGHPLVDGDKVFCLVGGEGSAVVALHKDTGKELWKALTVEEIGYAPPVMIEAGGKKQLIVWHTEALNALDPETGKLYWSEPLPKDVQPVRPGITVATPKNLGDLLFVTAAHHGPLMMKLDAARPVAAVLWRGKSDDVSRPDGLHSVMSTPVLAEGHVYGVCAFGELRCLKADTGERLWETHAATTGKRAFFGTAFLVRHAVAQADRFFIFNDQGDLIVARLSPKGYEELDRAHLLDPVLFSRGRDVVWSHPAFANRCVYARNDKEMVCVSLAEEG